MSSRGVYLEVCAGAGGWGLGLRDAGWSGTGLEKDADAAETHRRNVGPCLDADVTTCASPHAGDLVCGGVPCQPFSHAGDQEGLDDPRGQLFRALLRHAGEAQARVVAMENVRGLISVGALAVVLTAFRAEGFEPVHALLNAVDFGVPQSRPRLFIVGFRDAADLARFRWPAPTHGAPGNLFGLPRWRTVRDALGLGSAAGESDSLVDRPAATVTSTHGGLSKGSQRDDEPSRRDRFRADLAAARRLDAPSPCISAGGTGRGGAEPLTNAKVRRELLGALAAARVLDRAATVVDTKGTLSAAGRSHESSNKGGAVRLSPRDCARLQSFPDDFDFVGNVTSQYRQIGNAVPPKLGQAMDRSLWTALYG